MTDAVYVPDLFKVQMKENDILTQDHPQIAKGRTDYFGLQYEVGEPQLYALIKDSNGANIVDLSPRSLMSFDMSFAYNGMHAGKIPTFTKS